MDFNSYRHFLGFGDFSDLYFEESNHLAIKWEEEKINSISQEEMSGVGLRYLNGQETRFINATCPAPLSRNLTETDRHLLQNLQDQLSSGLPRFTPSSLRGTVTASYGIQKPSVQISLKEKIALMKRAFQAAQVGPHIRQVTINYGEKIKKVGYVNSEGESFIEKRCYLVFSMTVTVERNGDLQTAYDSMGGLVGWELFNGGRVESLARSIAQRAHLKLDAPKAPAGEMPVVIASCAGGTLIHEAVGHSLEADAVLEGSSPSYVGKIGQTVANEKLIVFDNPTLSSARGSFYFDDEGIPSEPTKLIDHGVLKDYMFDRVSARKAKRSSNGHGRRESYAHRPIPRMSNTYIAPGPDNPGEIIKSLRNGFLVTRMGGGQVNTANGDFVFEVEEGFQVKEGKKQLVRGATLLGNGPEVLKMIDKVGSDQGWSIGTCGKEGQGVPVSDGIPTIHIQKLVIGG